MAETIHRRLRTSDEFNSCAETDPYQGVPRVHAGLLPHFDSRTLFSAQMVENGKPAPDLFLCAAHRMGVDPRDCLVVEGSPPGVQAACAADMEVVGFTAGAHARPSLSARLIDTGASCVFPSTDELERFLALS